MKQEVAHERVPEISFDTQLFESSKRLEAFSTLIQSLYECWPLGDAQDLSVQVTGHRVDDLVFNQVSFSPMFFRRSERYLRASRADFLVLEAQLSGEQYLQMDAGQMRLQPRHIHLRDWACTFEAETTGMNLWSVAIPRNRLRFSSVLSPENPVITWSMERPDGRMLALLWGELFNSMSTEPAVEVENLSQSFLTFLNSLLGHQEPKAGGTTLAALQQFLILRLRTNVGVADLCEHFHISRSTVYRLFEPLGGVARFIRQARLERCHLELRRSNPKLTRINSVAVSWGFTDASMFSRCFRSYFGESPSAVLGKNQLLNPSGKPVSVAHPEWSSSLWYREYMTWFNELTGWDSLESQEKNKSR
jgi:AraC-like DNA-binding protein